MALKPYLQLIRLPNVFTAAADSLAGWAIVHGGFDEPHRWLPLALASMAIYAAGIALNDVFDYEVDRLERPNRPLPSGRVSRRFAATLGFALLAAGPLLAMASGSDRSVAVAFALAVCVLGYDLGLKRTVLGPEMMGACRGLNVVLGASQSPWLGGPILWGIAGGMTLFVAGLTWISRHEAVEGRRGGAILGTALQALALTLLGVLALGILVEEPNHNSRSALGLGLGGMVLVGVAGLVGHADDRAIRRPAPETLQAAVKTGVLSLIWINVGMTAALAGPGPACLLAALWPPAFLLSRRLYST